MGTTDGAKYVTPQQTEHLCGRGPGDGRVRGAGPGWPVAPFPSPSPGSRVQAMEALSFSGTQAQSPDLALVPVFKIQIDKILQILPRACL